jgi:hypothetical protein
MYAIAVKMYQCVFETKKNIYFEKSYCRYINAIAAGTVNAIIPNKFCSHMYIHEKLHMHGRKIGHRHSPM